MTHPRRCEHEKICRFYPSYCEERNRACPQGAGCNYDTRCASHSSAPVPDGYAITEVMLQHAEWLRSEYPGKAKEWDDFILVIRSHPVESEQSIRQDEREKVLKICVNERKKLTFDSSFATDNAYNEGRLSIIKIIEEELRKQEQP